MPGEAGDHPGGGAAQAARDHGEQPEDAPAAESHCENAGG